LNKSPGKWGYDANGNQAARSDATATASGTTTFSYDALNRLTRESLPDASSTTYTYDGLGNLSSLTDPGGRLAYTYNAVNLLTSVTEPSGARTSFSYDAADNRTATTYPNGVTITQAYDAARRPIDIWAKTSAGATLNRFTYGYTNSATGKDTGLRQRVTDAAGNTTTYAYDGLDRLVQARTTTSAGAVSSDYRYTYDGNSNRLTETLGASTTTSSYNAANQLTASGATTYAYDANGNNTSSSSGRAMAYNAANQTVSITPPGGSAIPMAYAGPTQDQRIRAGATTFRNNLLGVAGETTGTASTYYSRDNRGALLSERTPAGTFYYLFDALGSVTGLTNTSGAVVATYTYDPFGRPTQITEAVANPWRFAGGYLDAATGLTKFGTRYYDATLGRWTSRTPWRATSPTRGPSTGMCTWGTIPSTWWIQRVSRGRALEQ
jgi:RHS repeat-associated protein